MTNGTLTILRAWDDDNRSNKLVRRTYECQVNVTSGATPVTFALTDFPGAVAWAEWSPFTDSAGAMVQFASVGALTNVGDGFYPTGTLATGNIAATGNGYVVIKVRG